MAEVGTVFVSVVPSARGFGNVLNSQIGPAAAAAGKSGGAAYGGTFRGAVGSALKGFGAIFAVGAIVKGIGSVIDAGREAQKVGAATAQIIKATGGAAKISAKQVGQLT